MIPVSRRILGPVAGLCLALLPVSTGRRVTSGRAAESAIPATIQSDLKPGSLGGAAKARLEGSYGKLPLSFEVNRGQAGEAIRFLTRGPGYTLLLTGQDALLSLSNPKAEASDGSGRQNHARVATAEKRRVTADVLGMTLLNASQAAEPTGVDELPGKVNYFIGNDPKKWRSNIPTYAKVRYRNVYPGIDLIYYGREGKLEYDFVVEPGADPSVIALGFEGASDRQRLPHLRMDKAGNVLIEGGSNVLRLTKPVIYQPRLSTTGPSSQSTPRNAKSVDGRFVLTASNRIRFKLGPYDKSQPLVIDPGLVYSTFLGFQGSGSSLAVDSAGNLFIAGSFPGTGFAATPGAFNRTRGVAFVAKVNSTGSALLYSTYFGGTTSSGIGGESGPFLALDSSDNVYLTGYTTATDFPITPGAFQPKLENLQGSSPFVTKLNPTGSALVYSTYFRRNEWH